MMIYLDGLTAQPCVFYALVDLMQYGRDALDLGAWQGGMSTIMSRLSGPRGQIVAVEASRTYAERCQRYLVENGCSNVFLINRAVWSDSESEVTFREHALWPQGGKISERPAEDDPNVTLRAVKTVCVDDIVSDFGLCPYLIKADLEGAERAMIAGARKTIDSYRPILILEQDLSQADVAEELLRTHCYAGVCLENYELILEPANFYPLHHSFNAVFIPQEAFVRSPYGKLDRSVHASIAPSGSDAIELPPGRYVIRAAEDARAALRQAPFSIGLTLSVSNAFDTPIYETTTNGTALAIGHVLALSQGTQATITLTPSDHIGRNTASLVTGLIVEKIFGSLPQLMARYNDLAIP